MAEKSLTLRQETGFPGVFEVADAESELQNEARVEPERWWLRDEDKLRGGLGRRKAMSRWLCWNPVGSSGLGENFSAPTRHSEPYLVPLPKDGEPRLRNEGKLPPCGTGETRWKPDLHSCTGLGPERWLKKGHGFAEFSVGSPGHQ